MDKENLLASDVGYLKDALTILNEIESSKETQKNLNQQIKELEKNIQTREKACNDEIEFTMKKRREEIASSFDKQIRKEQDNIRKIRNDREKAKNKGMQGRIEIETMDLKGENDQITTEIKEIIKDSSLLKICGYKIFYILFSPKGIVELLILFLTMAALLFGLPYGIFLLLPTRRPIWLLVISFILNMLFFVTYQMIAQKTKVVKGKEIAHIKGLQDKISANNHKIRAVKNSILKDKNEKIYDLESFDKQIKELEENIKNITKEKQEALTSFEGSTKNMLIEEIQGRYQGDIKDYQIKQDNVLKERKGVEDFIRDRNKHMTAYYEAFLGKDYVTKEALENMIILMEQENASTVAEALALYKSER